MAFESTNNQFLKTAFGETLLQWQRDPAYPQEAQHHE